MTKKATNKSINKDILLENYHKLSIQVSLNGLSFCVLDSIGKTITNCKELSFGRELTPFEVQKELKSFLRDNAIEDYAFSDVVVVHRNNLFSLVPQALFDKKEVANYLKFNAKILANDLIEYDEISSYDLVNVYVPFSNINNFIYELFGEFNFYHHGSIMIQAVLAAHKISAEEICYVYLSEGEMDIIITGDKKLLYYNNFHFTTTEDFLYYLLFTFEQLKLDSRSVKLRLFGNVEEGDALYTVSHEYVQSVSIYLPSNPEFLKDDIIADSTNYLVINAFK